ncbi:hypothetical protein PHYC_03190 [Phycisphaerales bacterium]|nr:hypothetical protein PHYC_03190 [Phycisphaerales bacterium]
MKHIVLLAALASTAAAQPLETELRFEVRRFDPAHNTGWATSLNALPGDHVEVRAVVSYIGTSTVYGLGQIIFQPIIADWTAADSIIGTPGTPGGIGIGPTGSNTSTPPGYVQDLPGVYGRISPWAGANTTTSNFYRGHFHENPNGTGRTYLRIARADVTNWIGIGASSGSGAANNTSGAGGVTIAQGTLGAGRPTNLPPQNNSLSNLIVFKFGFVIDPDSGPRDLTIAAPIGPYDNPVIGPHTFRQPDTRWYNAPDQTAPGLHRTDVLSLDAMVHIAPTPPALAASLVCIVLATRRSRVRVDAP